MFADAKREGCGIAWNHKLLCWANEDCCKLVPSTETKFGAFGLKSSREACCKLSDIFPWCVMEADLYELKTLQILFTLNCAMKFSGDPPSNNCKTFVFQTKRLATFFSEACRPAFCSALGKNLLIWFLQSGDSV